MTSAAYRIPEAPVFKKDQVWAYWKSNPSTHAALGHCPACNKRQLIKRECHELGLPPECHACSTPVITLDLVAL